LIGAAKFDWGGEVLASARQTMNEQQNNERIRTLEAELGPALSHFRQSVNVWSESVWSEGAGQHRPVPTARTLGWRLAAGWAVVVLLAVVSLGGVAVRRGHRQVPAVHPSMISAAAPVAAVQVGQSPAAELKPDRTVSGVEDEDLLAKVGSDVARQTPRALEPLAQLMDEDGLQ
jgi:hypothetical protein